jgi:hypothetical protein
MERVALGLRVVWCLVPQLYGWTGFCVQGNLAASQQFLMHVTALVLWLLLWLEKVAFDWHFHSNFWLVDAHHLERCF